MKKAFCLLLALLLLMALTACGGNTEEAARQGSGVVSQSSTVDQVLAGAGKEETAPAQTETAVPAQTETAPASAAAAERTIDVNLTKLSATMVYSEVYNMVSEPDAYIGKVVRMAGTAASTYYDVTDRTYHAIIIADATACCAQGIEYELPEGQSYPEDDAETTVTGVFSTYDEFGRTYVYLEDATLGTGA